MAVLVRKGQRHNQSLHVISRSASVSGVPYSVDVRLAVNARFRLRSVVSIVIHSSRKRFPRSKILRFEDHTLRFLKSIAGEDSGKIFVSRVPIPPKPRTAQYSLC